MKKLYIWFIVMAVGIAACSNSIATTPTIPTAVRIEVTRLVQITTTPVPSKISTPTATLKPEDWQSTQIADMAGTPIVANSECYQTAMTQAEMNNCSIERRDEIEKQMEQLQNSAKDFYSYSEEELQTFLKFQAEWEDFTKRECTFLSGNYPLSGDSGVLKGGSMARMSYNECLVQKYEDRLRELQLLLMPRG